MKETLAVGEPSASRMDISSSADFSSDSIANSPGPDDLAREVYGVLGVPIDAIDMATVIPRVKTAAGNKTPYLISTANLNFLVTSQSDAEFRASLLLSDLCTADGMPIVWLARLLKIPVQTRVAGSDLFEALKFEQTLKKTLKVFFFGGNEGVAERACQKLNSETRAMACAGWLYPGFGTITEMSTNSIIDTINRSGADFLGLALGAKKGQAWLSQNHDRIQVPIRVHFGAVINFQAGSAKRAPVALRNSGFEWLWRIKEEPYLWRRYWNDGFCLIRLVLTRAIPLRVLAQWHSIGYRRDPLSLNRVDDLNAVTLHVNGDATAEYVKPAIEAFRMALDGGRDIVINCARMQFIDARFIGLLLMLDKQLKQKHRRLTFMKVPRRIERILRLSGFEFLLRR